MTALPYLGDDFEVLRSVGTRGPLGMWVGDSTALFRPVASVSAWLDVVTHGGQAFYSHLHSVLLYGGTALLVWALARSLRIERPALTALLFYSLANHTEPVAWFAARADLLATLFFLMSLVLCLRTGRLATLACALTGSLALASKESAFLLSLVAAAVCLMLGRELRRPLMLAALTGVYLVVRHSVVGAWVGGYGTAALPSVSWATLERVSDFLCASVGVDHAPSVLPLLGLLALSSFAPDRRRAFGLLGAFVLVALPAAGLSGSLENGENARLYFLPSVFACLIVANLLGRVRYGSLGLFALVFAQVGLVREREEQWASAGRVVERYLDKLVALPNTKVRAVAVPGWVGPACALCTGADAAVSLRQGGRSNRVLAVARYRVATSDCLPDPDEQPWKVSLVLPSCGAWVAPQEQLPGLELAIEGNSLRLTGSGVLFAESEHELVPLIPPRR